MTAVTNFWAYLLPGGLVAFGGFIFLALVQMGRAAVDTAEYTQQMLKIARDQLEVSRQGLSGGRNVSEGFAALNEAGDSASESAGGTSSGYGSLQSDSEGEANAEKTLEIVEHKGQTIEVRDGQYYWHDTPYSSLEEVDHQIEQAREFNPHLLTSRDKV